MGPLRERLLPYLARYRGGLALGLVCVAIANLVALAQPQVLRLSVDDLYKGVTAAKLGRYAVLLFALALTSGAFRFVMRQIVIGISRHVEFDLRNDFFAHLQRLGADYFQRTRTGDLMARATNDLAAVRMMIGPAIMYLVNTIVVTIVSVGFMLHISPRLTLFALLPLPFVSLTMWFFGDRTHRRFEEIQADFAELSARVQENLAGVRVVRAFHDEAREVADFGRLNERYRGKSLDLSRVSALFDPTLAFFSGLASLLALYVGGREVVAGRITLGQYVAFTVYLGMLNWPMVALGWVVNLFQRGSASFDRLAQVFDAAPGVANLPGAVSPAECRGAIEFRNLTFTYPGADRPALSGVSLAVEPGTTVAIVGRTGCGKSTLLSLLTRVFDPPEGAVRLDGRDVRTLDLAWLRRRVAAAPQDTFLFSTTVAENIAYGAEQATPEAIAAAARIAGLHDDVLGFPRGYETLVGERGITLSGGQKQRVAIARAVLRDAPVLLLDDCLSSVDTQTEERILRGLSAEIARRTTLIVSHRVSTVRDADRIFVLDGGALVEQGTHDELLALGGHYARLTREQQIEEELEAS